MSKKPTVLMILDGYGLSDKTEGNAVKQAKTPVMDKLIAKYPFVQGEASGMAVGLPDGQMGNSEVGHTNMGAGRIVYQMLVKISKSIQDGDFFENKALVAAMENCKKNDSALHLMGLLSPGGVHSHMEHLYGLLEMAKKNGLEKVYVHAYLDGRDVPPSSAAEYMEEVAKIKEIGVGSVATISGRFYAMDRDNAWDREEKAYSALVYGEGVQADDPVQAIKDSYANDVTDEFMLPTVVDKNGMIHENDSEKTDEAIDKWLDIVGLDSSILSRYPHELSGGQQQRVGIARALAASPAILLMDEPFSAVDEITRTQLQKEMKEIHEKTKITVMFVTHDIREALYLADKVLVMQNGIVHQFDTPNEVLNHPATPFVEKLLERTKFILNK